MISNKCLSVCVSEREKFVSRIKHGVGAKLLIFKEVLETTDGVTQKANKSLSKLIWPLSPSNRT